MTDVYRKGGFEPDTWPQLAPEDPVPPGGGVLLSKTRYMAEREAIAASNAVVGVVLEPNDRLEDLGEDLDRIPVVAVKFPKFADGRAFSLARLLRDRYGFKGEIRATGDVLLDLIPHMARVGIDAFVVEHGPTRAHLAEGKLPIVPYYYQPASDHADPVSAKRPWLRRPADLTTV
jgi:phosphoadenosine phosphosulfate reductase